MASAICRACCIAMFSLAFSRPFMIGPSAMPQQHGRLSTARQPMTISAISQPLSPFFPGSGAIGGSGSARHRRRREHGGNTAPFRQALMPRQRIGRDLARRQFCAHLLERKRSLLFAVKMKIDIGHEPSLAFRVSRSNARRVLPHQCETTPSSFTTSRSRPFTRAS